MQRENAIEVSVMVKFGCWQVLTMVLVRERTSGRGGIGCIGDINGCGSGGNYGGDDR